MKMSHLITITKLKTNVEQIAHLFTDSYSPLFVSEPTPNGSAPQTTISSTHNFQTLITLTLRLQRHPCTYGVDYSLSTSAARQGSDFYHVFNDPPKSISSYKLTSKGNLLFLQSN